MNYYLHKGYYCINNWYNKIHTGCLSCYKEYMEISEYMLDNRIIL